MTEAASAEKRAATTPISTINFVLKDFTVFQNTIFRMVFLLLNLSDPIQVSDRMGQRVSLF